MAVSISPGGRRMSAAASKRSPQGKPAVQAAPARIVVTKVFVRGLALEALIGVRAHERGQPQPLLVDVELDVAAGGWRRLADTVNYEHVARQARLIAASGHIGLVESFAHRLAMACMEE